MNLRFGILGAGRISKRFAAVLKDAPEVTLAGIASRDLGRAQSFAGEFGAPIACDDYLDLIRDDRVDAIYVGLTTNAHYEITRQCLLAHKPVLCEKSLVRTRREAEALVELAQKNRVLLVEAMWTRFLPAIQKARGWVKSGRIGMAAMVEASFCFKAEYDPHDRLFDPALGGGSMYDIGVYPIDFTLGILDEYPDAVSGIARLAPTGVDEAAAVSLRFPSGALASLDFGFTHDAPRIGNIFGTQGSIIVEECLNPHGCKLFDKDGKLVEEFYEPVEDGFIYQVEHFASLWRSGALESDLLPWKDTLACTAIFDELNRQWGISTDDL